MKHVAVIDDDPVETVILSGLAEHLSGAYAFEHFSTVDAFCTCPHVDTFDVAFLDRRVPPYSDYPETLPMVEQTRFNGTVVMLTARRLGPYRPHSRLKLLGPYEKFDVQDAEIIENLLEGRPALGL